MHEQAMSLWTHHNSRKIVDNDLMHMNAHTQTHKNTQTYTYTHTHTYTINGSSDKIHYEYDDKYPSKEDN